MSSTYVHRAFNISELSLSGPFYHSHSKFNRVNKAIITLLANGCDGGSADFRIRLEQFQEPPYTFNRGLLILRVRDSTTANNIVDDLGVNGQ